ncbi:hypothetical protein BV25DRAFT_1824327 [Artomyces pyxidatus]|uniref:Uncharacterized protein n=1 Tax=Artomyces pyxidatus TaxID=48021 RepID=A0ACB8T3H3_9AGAM|nr:hypothetical protein BV25DRAFT_1824327 [Artomyces pyxidatus]
MSPDPLTPSSPPPTLPVILDSVPINDPPPPYPSRDRRSRAGRRSRRSTVTTLGQGHAHEPSGGTDSDPEGTQSILRSSLHSFPDDDHLAAENTPLLGVRTPPRPPRLLTSSARRRTVSQSSGASMSPSLAQTVVSAFRMDDSDLDSEDAEARDGDADADGGVHDAAERGRLRTGQQMDDMLPFGPGISRRKAGGWRSRWRRYFRPVGRRAYWVPLVHLLLLNFPYALLAWVYLFVFTLLGTILLVALPLGAVLCFFDLLGARILARGEVLLQSTFHGPLAYNLDYPLPPIFTRTRVPTSAEEEAGVGSRAEHSFYRNTYSMFTDSTSYQALFYFLVIKPGITILLSLLLVILVPVSLLLVFPAPAMLRLVRRLGIWQANVAVEGLYMGPG